MKWTEAAEQAHGAAVDLVQIAVEGRYGWQAALVAEDEAAYVLEAHAEDLARQDALALGSAPLVTPAHVSIAAGAYRFRPSLAQRFTARFGRIVRSLGTT